MERAPVRAPLIKNLELKVGLLLAGTALLAAAFLAYVLYARGVFEPTQQLILVADNADGVSVGMPLSFSGFPIGKVSRLALTEEGKVRIHVQVPVKDARWLRTSSVFTLEKGLVGGAKIKAFSTTLSDPPLPDMAERDLLTGDATQDIPVIMASVKAILANVEAMTQPDSSINRSLASVGTITQRMAGRYGVLEGMLGGPEEARKVVQAIERANALIASLNGVSLKVDQVLAKTDQRLYGRDGVMGQVQGIMGQVQGAIAQVSGVLGDVRQSLAKADAILAEAQGAAANVKGITADVKGATADLALLRTEVDDSLRKVNHLINEINRKWPFARDVELKLP